ncbi:MAG: sigma-54-dependent Fis family transcriptional regulator [Candidatus Tectomicrobia bacterium]|uniref:Sigma-54-dependent Fis family transcriptional regulator n=1 Tax=Tectimicrobiota bacterium TaxID=2528274 RepID=A0A933GLX3_UNCTE|nr:sigma-54-dependent Fis family transcriptional regulator [Candidatus Tectomicrobia bacterium]
MEVMAEKILVVDDQFEMQRFLKKILERSGKYLIDIASSGHEALSKAKNTRYSVVLSDVKMPGMSGLELLQELRRIDHNIMVIMVTGFGTIDSAVEAIRHGAFHYITKPFDNTELVSTVDKAMELWQLQLGNRSLLRQDEAGQQFPNIIGKSQVIQSVFELIQRVAPSPTTILITGESGTGKELVAKAIHFNSFRKDKKFVTIDCAALPESVLESELFGHVKGSFTGAIKDKKGLFEEGNGGTIFLDEIGDIGKITQMKLLRILQEGEFRAVGDVRTKKVDIRIIAATNKDLKEKVMLKEFREDLYYRLDVVSIHLPPLRERKEDIPLLISHFLNFFSASMKKKIRGIAPEVMEAFMNYSWPGNVRQLENSIERLVTLTQHEILGIEDIPSSMLDKTSQSGYEDDLFQMPYKSAKRMALSEFNRRYVQQALIRCDGNVSKAARLCQIERQYFQQLMKKTALRSEDYR